MDLIRQALLEKLARDSGFDRQGRRHGAWLVVGSSHFGEEVLLKPSSASGQTEVALAARSRPHSPGSVSGIVEAASQAAADFGTEMRELWTADSDAALGALLGIVAEAARNRREQPL